MAFNIHHQLVIASERAKIYAALVNPEGLNNWWTLTSEGRPETGTSYRFYFGPEFDWTAVVEEMRENRLIRYRIVEAMHDWIGTEITFRISEEKGQSVLSFVHSGWKTESSHFAVTTYCWGQLLKGLKDYIENGAIVPFGKRN